MLAWFFIMLTLVQELHGASQGFVSPGLNESGRLAQAQGQGSRKPLETINLAMPRNRLTVLYSCR